MFRPGRRLYFRVYLTVLASLALTALLTGLAWHFSADSGPSAATTDLLAELASEILPPAPPASLQTTLDNWHARARMSSLLIKHDGTTIAAAGEALPRPDRGRMRSGWLHAAHAAPAFALRLPDERWLIVRSDDHRRHTPFGFIAMLLIIALAVGIAAYPMVRRLTRRLERLQLSVEALGEGNFAARVEMPGHDEVAWLAASFNHAAARIESLMQAQKSLLANASHELRSPLARIRVAIELLHSSADTAVAAELQRDIEELDQLIEEILLASRLDAPISAQVSQTAFDFTALVAEECARVKARLDADLVDVSGDAKLLRRVVRNLLENAVRYGTGLEIEVTLRRSGDRQVELSVGDRGPGVPPGEQENIFRAFYRVPGAGADARGVGLGLALVKQIVELHHGTVSCAPRAGGGTCFTVYLPSTTP
jgi:signal transduction histidine kinase